MIIVLYSTNGVCLDFVDPLLDSESVGLFWKPDLCPHILHANIFDGRQSVQPFELKFSRLECEILTLKQYPDLTHYMFREGRKSLQICCRDKGLYASDKKINRLKLIFQMGDMVDYREQDLARKRLRYLAEKGCLPDHLFKANKASRRFKQILDVIDIQNRGHFPSDDAATKLLYLALRNAAKKWTMPSRTWKQALNQFAVLFHDRFPSSIY